MCFLNRDYSLCVYSVLTLFVVLFFRIANGKPTLDVVDSIKSNNDDVNGKYKGKLKM